MNDVIVQIIENCGIDFANCYNGTCPIFAECEQYREEHREYFVLSIDEITDEQLAYNVNDLYKHIGDLHCLTNEQLDKYWNMNEIDQRQFGDDLDNRVLELLQQKVKKEQEKVKKGDR